jgi:hypothetical protein
MERGACGGGRGGGEGDCSPYGGQEAEWTSNRKEAGQDTAPKNTLPMTYFLQPDSTLHRSIVSEYSVQILNPSMD